MSGRTVLTSNIRRDAGPERVSAYRMTTWFQPRYRVRPRNSCRLLTLIASTTGGLAARSMVVSVLNDANAGSGS